MRNYWAWIALLSLTSCDIGGYDTGTGAYSLTRADFVAAHTGEAFHVDYVITDDNDSLPISGTLQNSALSKANTLYRGVLYYNKIVNEEKDTVAQPVFFSVVSEAKPVKADKMAADSMYTDPVYFVSAWRSSNAKYINLGLNILTGKVNGSDGVHHFGLIEDTIRTSADGKKCAELRLFHNQNSVPEYYTSRTYISMPMNYYDGKLSTGDTISVTINTYDDATVTKQFVYTQN